jgi:hypothetical protein
MGYSCRELCIGATEETKVSSLKWTEAPHTSVRKPTVITIYWELWGVGEDKTAWYNMPRAQIRKIKDKQWELVLMNAIHDVRNYRTLKAAKAMGIALVRMDDAV